MRITFFLLLIWFFSSEPGFFILDKTRNIEPGGPGEGIAVYFINLDSSPTRRNTLIPYLEELGYPYERVSGVNGKYLSKEEISQIYDRNFNSKITNTPLTRWELGVSLSHIKALETFLNSNYKYAIIFEDDIAFDPKRLRKLVDNILYQDNRNVDMGSLCILENFSLRLLT